KYKPSMNINQDVPDSISDRLKLLQLNKMNEDSYILISSTLTSEWKELSDNDKKLYCETCLNLLNKNMYKACNILLKNSLKNFDLFRTKNDVDIINIIYKNESQCLF